MTEKFFIEVPYYEKEYAKERGAKWDKDEKKWYVDDINDELYELYKRVNLTVDYNNKNIVKENYARWDHQTKMWFTYQSNDKLKEFMQ